MALSGFGVGVVVGGSSGTTLEPTWLPKAVQGPILSDFGGPFWAHFDTIF